MTAADGLLVLALAVAPPLVWAVRVQQRRQRTLRHVMRVVARLATGDLTARARLPVDGELGELGRLVDEAAARGEHTTAELRQEGDRFGRALAAMREGVLLLDGKGRVTLANPAVRGLLGLGPDVTGRTLVEATRRAPLLRLLDEARTLPEGVSREFDAGDLSPRRLLVRAAPLTDGMLAVLIDVTHLRRLESHRREFVANVSHELRTPIAAVRGAAETLHTALETDAAAAAEFAEIILRNALRLQHLVDDLLDLAQIEARTSPLDPESVLVAATIDAVLASLHARAAAKGVRLLTDVAADLAVRAERRALEQVLANLVDNALKYSVAGEPVVVGAMPVTGSRPPRVRLYVRDAGPGIEARHVERLFERFYRVDAGRSRTAGGTGLGLAIFKHLTEAMGGSVGVVSEPGRGSEFWVELEVAVP